MADARALRDWYLSTLGVVRYIPRDAPGYEADLTEPAVEPPPLAVRSRQDKTSVMRAVLDTEPAPAKPERKVDQKPAPDKQAPDEVPFSCRLAFWQPSDDLVVLSTLSPGQRPGEAQLTMLARLLKAIKRLDGNLPAFDLIDWPQTRNAGTSLAAAREFMAVFLEAKAFLKPFSHALIMGEVATQLVTEQGFNAGNQISLVGKATGIVTYSLEQMEKDPALKAPTWEAIRFLAEQ
jgi:hypothetical protein